MIPFSCADYSFPLLPREKRFALIKLLGFDYVDVGLFARTRDLNPDCLHTDPKRFTTELLEDLKRAGLSASDIFLQIGPEPSASAANDPSAHVRSHNRKTFQLAVIFAQPSAAFTLPACRGSCIPAFPRATASNSLHKKLAGDNRLPRRSTSHMPSNRTWDPFVPLSREGSLSLKLFGPQLDLGLWALRRRKRTLGRDTLPPTLRFPHPRARRCARAAADVGRREQNGFRRHAVPAPPAELPRVNCHRVCLDRLGALQSNR